MVCLFALLVTRKRFGCVSSFLSHEQTLVHSAASRSSSSPPARTARQKASVIGDLPLKRISARLTHACLISSLDLSNPSLLWTTYALYFLLPHAQLHLQVRERTEGPLPLLVLLSLFVFQHALQLRLYSGQKTSEDTSKSNTDKQIGLVEENKNQTNNKKMSFLDCHLSKSFTSLCKWLPLYKETQ